MKRKPPSKMLARAIRECRDSLSPPARRPENLIGRWRLLDRHGPRVLVVVEVVGSEARVREGEQTRTVSVDLLLRVLDSGAMQYLGKAS